MILEKGKYMIHMTIEGDKIINESDYGAPSFIGILQPEEVISIHNNLYAWIEFELTTIEGELILISHLISTKNYESEFERII